MKLVQYILLISPERFCGNGYVTVIVNHNNAIAHGYCIENYKDNKILSANKNRNELVIFIAKKAIYGKDYIKENQVNKGFRDVENVRFVIGYHPLEIVKKKITYLVEWTNLFNCKGINIIKEKSKELKEITWLKNI